MSFKLFEGEGWIPKVYQKDYSMQSIGDIKYRMENFDVIFESKVLVPAAIMKIDPKNPHSDTILTSFFKEAIAEYRVSKNSANIIGKEQRDFVIEESQRKYGLSTYDPEDTSWFKLFYKKWIKLFAGEYMSR